MARFGSAQHQLVQNRTSRAEPNLARSLSHGSHPLWDIFPFIVLFLPAATAWSCCRSCCYQANVLWLWSSCPHSVLFFVLLFTLWLHALTILLPLTVTLSLLRPSLSPSSWVLLCLLGFLVSALVPLSLHCPSLCPCLCVGTSPRRHAPAPPCLGCYPLVPRLLALWSPPSLVCPPAVLLLPPPCHVAAPVSASPPPPHVSLPMSASLPFVIAPPSLHRPVSPCVRRHPAAAAVSASSPPPIVSELHCVGVGVGVAPRRRRRCSVLSCWGVRSALGRRPPCLRCCVAAPSHQCPPSWGLRRRVGAPVSALVHRHPVSASSCWHPPSLAPPIASPHVCVGMSGLHWRIAPHVCVVMLAPPVVGALVVGSPVVGAPVVGAPAVGSVLVQRAPCLHRRVGAPVVGSPVIGAPAVGSASVRCTSCLRCRVGAPTRWCAPSWGLRRRVCVGALAPHVCIVALVPPVIGAPAVGSASAWRAPCLRCHVGAPVIGSPVVGAPAVRSALSRWCPCCWFSRCRCPCRRVCVGVVRSMSASSRRRPHSLVPPSWGLCCRVGAPVSALVCRRPVSASVSACRVCVSASHPMSASSCWRPHSSVRPLLGSASSRWCPHLSVRPLLGSASSCRRPGVCVGVSAPHVCVIASASPIIGAPAMSPPLSLSDAFAGFGRKGDTGQRAGLRQRVIRIPL
jgi:hypothetical protein